MTLLNFLYRNGIIVAAPLFVFSAALLAICIVGLVRLGDRSQLFTLPFIEQQMVQLSDAGWVDLSLEGPRFSSRFSELAFELLSPDGTRMSSRSSWFHARTSGMSTVRMELVSFQIPSAGQYTLRIRNLGTARDGDTGHRVVLSKPHLPRMVGYVLGVVLSAALLIGSVVLFSLRLLSEGVSP